MKLTALSLLIIVASAISASAQQSSQNAENIFQRYFQQAKVVSSAYPQEKVYLHFDNTSYYAGDTIYANRDFRPPRGIRTTRIHGYARPS